jgi:hypothetical protein
VYLNVHYVLVTVEAVHKIVEVKSSPLLPLNTLNERKSALASGGSIAAAREEERERVQESASVPTSFHLTPFTCSLSMDININTNHLNHTCSF